MSKQNKRVGALSILAITVGFLSSGQVFAETYTTSISTSGIVSLDLLATGGGAKTAVDNVNIVSTCPSGYELSIAGPVDTTLYKDGNSSNTSSSKKINASSGTLENPVSLLGDNRGTWGYMTEELNNNNPIDANSNFIGLTHEQTIIKASSVGTTAQGDNLAVYYGASAGNSMEPGAYTMAESSTGANDNMITYYLTPSQDCMSYVVNYSPTSIVDEEEITGFGEMGAQRISEDVATGLATNSFAPPVGYRFDGWNTAQDGSGDSYSDGQEVTNLTSAGQEITLYAMWEPRTYTINYNGNGGSEVEGAGVSGYTFVYKGGFDWDSTLRSMRLKTANYKRSGYGFAGWSVDPDVATHINESSRSKIYGAEDIFTTSDYDLVSHAAEDSGIIELYAVWVPSEGDLQGWTGCDQLNVGEATALTDTRDNETYAVAKLADGNCWTIENSRLDPGTAIITADNTNHPTQAFVAMNNTHGWGAGISGSTSASDWCSTASTSCVDRILYNRENLDGLSEESGYGDPRYGYGIYYNWYTATAGNGLLSTSSTGTQVTSVSGDLCPAGWHIPTGGPGGEFETYIDTLPFGQSNEIFSFPDNQVAAGGIFSSGVTQSRDELIYLQSDSVIYYSDHTNNAHDFFAGYNNTEQYSWISRDNSHFKGRGVPFRCISND